MVNKSIYTIDNTMHIAIIISCLEVPTCGCSKFGRSVYLCSCRRLPSSIHTKSTEHRAQNTPIYLHAGADGRRWPKITMVTKNTPALHLYNHLLIRVYSLLICLATINYWRDIDRAHDRAMIGWGGCIFLLQLTG